MAILVTGGVGYIGSHTVLSLLKRGDEVIILDNLSNSSPVALERVELLAGKKAIFYPGDILNRNDLQQIFAKHDIDSVIHFAGLKSVGESVAKPLDYYQNNVTGSLVLLEEMRNAGVKNIIFSSSATVYGLPEAIPITENAPVGGTTHPYGTSKLMVEQILQDFVRAEPDFTAITLRYFNPVGAHESGLIGEDPNGIPNNLLPYISQVAVGKLAELSVFGGDYPTKDGTGVRDYIHVMDLAEGHLNALDVLSSHRGFNAYNLGTGIGYSVLEMIKAFERVSATSIPYRVVSRRAGDIAEYWSDPSLAKEKLGWQATRDLTAMMNDTWNWQRNNVNGYAAK
ncbi:UDP-glucose 4-epimerase GalE [Budvicia diplopodorum]|uniref:UDP-glucose 4-epimerase GalE n=1 Tax=Budvicia diplopodorum TaxID=1119056 RepID=UPI00135A6566|nr:UDP-glucose 4-epimerase GalE [Budvicia diplopodorum]